MSDSPTHEEVARIVADTVDSFRHDECRTCDCFQGFLMQLELDAEDDVSDLVDPLKKPREDLHGCLGCNPCPPGAAFARYIKERQGA